MLAGTAGGPAAAFTTAVPPGSLHLAAAATSNTMHTHVVPLSSARPVPGSWAHPAPLQALGGHGSMESTNWSGYVASAAGARFAAVGGTWTVPEVRPGPTGYSSSWVGIDGTSTQDLIQAGTEQDWGPQGVVYYAWYEVLPASSMYLGPVFPGDRVSVDITKAGPASWTIDVHDLTRGTLWTGAVSYTVPGSSAEWVEEAPTNGQTSALYPLANFGAVQFSGLSVGGPGTESATISPIYMVTSDTGRVEAYPGRYRPASNSFDVAFGKPAAGPQGWPAVRLGKSLGTGAATTGPAPTGPATTGPATTGPPPTGPATTGPAPTGPAPTGLSSTTGVPGTAGTTTAPGYWLVGGDGGVFSFGSARYGGSVARVFARAKLPGITGIAAAPGGKGYWLVTATGGVFPLGGASYLGSVASLNLSAGARPAIAAAPAGDGYYILSPWGDVFAFGSAHFEGSCNRAECGGGRAVALVPDATGHGYWVLLSNCKVVAFGDARPLASPSCQAATAASAAGRAPDGKGFWVLLRNGTVFSLGGATTYRAWSSPGDPGTKEPWPATDGPVKTTASSASEVWAVALVPTNDGQGAWVVRSNGSVEKLGDAPALEGLPPGAKLNQPIISAASS